MWKICTMDTNKKYLGVFPFLVVAVETEDVFKVTVDILPFLKILLSRYAHL